MLNNVNKRDLIWYKHSQIYSYLPNIIIFFIKVIIFLLLKSNRILYFLLIISPIYMVSGTRDNLPYGGNFIECL